VHIAIRTAAALAIVALLAGAADARDRLKLEGEDFEYLAGLANELTDSCTPPETLEEYERMRPGLEREYLDVLGLDPLPEKTPLNVRYVGEPVDLGYCVLKKVVFDSRPGLPVPCYLFVPRGPRLPVPAILYVPGSARQKPYLHHSLMYAAAGMVALAMPERPHNGPVKGENFHWYTTGYHPVGVEVWDVMRAVDFLETLDEVDDKRIGITGRSAGSYHAIWAGAAEPRIAVTIASQGANTAAGMARSLRYNIKGDHTVLHNCYVRDYARYWSLIAPRVLLIQHGSGDGMNSQSARIAGHIAGVHALYGCPERMGFQLFKQGHDDTLALRKGSYLWFDRWLRDGTGQDAFEDRTKEVLKDVDLSFGKDELRTKGEVIERMFTPPVPTWRIRSEADYRRFTEGLRAVLRSKVLRRVYQRDGARFDADERTLTPETGGPTRRMAAFLRHGERRPTVLLLGPADPAGPFPPEEASALAARLDASGHNLVYLTPAGVNDPMWVPPHMHRLAVVVGHTKTSMQVLDALHAVEALRAEGAVDGERIFLWGRGPLAVAALYAAVVDEGVAGVVLEDAPAHHTAETGLLHILRHADIPQSAALLFPRPVVLAGRIEEAFDWTRDVYRLLGRPERFTEADGEAEPVVRRLLAAP